MDLHGRSLLKETDLNADEFLFLVGQARQLRADKRRGVTGARLAGRNIALIFEKTSTRTRSAFEVAAHDEGGHVTYLGPGETQLGHKESVKDTARVLGRMFDGIEYRGFAQEAIESARRVRRGAGVERAHRQLAPDPDAGRHPDHDATTAASRSRDMSFCYLGDGRNNTANSLLVTGATARHGRPHLRPGGAAAIGGGAGDRRGPGRRVRRPAAGDRGRQHGRGRGGLRLHRRVGVHGRTGGPVGRRGSTSFSRTRSTRR